MKIVLGEIAIYGEKSGVCATCGKRRKRRHKFWGTFNPWSTKTRAEITDELLALRKEWLAQPMVCATCETAARDAARVEKRAGCVTQ